MLTPDVFGLLVFVALCAVFATLVTREDFPDPGWRSTVARVVFGAVITGALAIAPIITLYSLARLGA